MPATSRRSSSRTRSSKAGGKDSTTVVAMLGLLVYPHLLSNDRVAGEIMYWVEPSARGGGVRLLRAGERWAAAHGATVLQLVSPTPEVDQFYARCGYVPVERMYWKAL